MFCDSPICSTPFADYDTYVMSNGDILYFTIDIQQVEDLTLDIQQQVSLELDK